MATAIQRRRGTSAQHANFTGLAGEITIDTTLNTIIVHDGSTAGGIRLAKYTEVQSASEGDITAVNTNAGSGLTGGVTGGAANIAIDYENLTGNLVPSANNTYSLGSLTNVWKDVFIGPGSLYVNGSKVIEDSSGTIQFTADTNQNISILTTGTGDIELTTGGEIQLKSNVVISSGRAITTAGGGATKFTSNLNLNSNNINNLDDPVAAQDAATKAYVDAQVDTKDALSELSGDTDDVTEGAVNLYYTTARWDTKMASASTDDLSEGSTNQYFTTTRARDSISAGGDLTYTSGTGVISFTERTDAEVRGLISAGGDLSYNSSTGEVSFTERTDSEVRGLISVTDSGGDGSLAYNSGTGVITYTGPSAAEVQAHITAGDGMSVSSGEFSVDGTVVRTSANQNIGGQKTFTDDMVISGNLTVSGTTTTVSSETLSVADNIIDLNSNFTSGTPSENAGIKVKRGDSNDVQVRWDESTDRWGFTNDGSTYYDFPVSTADITENTNLYYTDARADARIALQVGTNLDLSNQDTGDLAEGSNQYFTTARARSSISAGGDLSYNSTTGVVSFTERTDAEVRGLVSAAGDLSYNSSTGAFSFTERTDAEVRGLVSATDAGGDGSFAYDSASGVFTYTGPSASEVRAHFAAGTGITISSGTIATTITQYTDSDARSALSGGTGITYDSSTGEIALSDTGYVSGVTAGAGLTGGGTTGNITISADTAAVANGASTLATGDQIYDFVLAQGYTTNVGDITGVTAGTGLSGGGSSGSVTLNVSGLTVSEFAGGSIQTGSEAFSDSDSVLMTAAAVQDKILSYGYTTAVGDITGVTAGTNLNGGGSSGSVTVNLDTTLTGMAAATFSGTVTAGLFSGTATSARYADLAEKYETDEILEAGTVVCFGGDKEVTACAHEAHHAVAGVISTDPAYMMNSDAEGQYVALAGRVPCKVVGPVAKGDLLVTSEVKGHAKADNDAPAGRIIGKAIGSSDSGEAVIEVLVNMM